MKKNNVVAIAGAGPIGLCLANLLMMGPYKDNLRVFDKKSRNDVFKRASSIQPRSFPVFKKLGVLKQVLERSESLLGNVVYEQGKRNELISFENPETGETPISLDQATLEGILRTELENRGLLIEYEKEVIGDKPNNKEFSLKAIDKISGDEEQLQPSIIVSCEGVKSSLRKIANIGFFGKTYNDNAFVSDCMGDIEFDRNYMHFAAEGQSRLVVIPLPGAHKYRISGAIEKSDAELTPDEIISILFNRLFHYSPNNLEVTHFSRYQIHAKMADRFSKDNLFLCGDAAHTFPPNGAQGLTLGLENAYFLGDILNHSSSSKEKVQIKYASRRRIAKEKMGQIIKVKDNYSADKLSDLDRSREEKRIQNEEL